MTMFPATLMFIIIYTRSGQAGKEYLMTFPDKTAATILTVAGPGEGVIRVKYPQQLQRKIIVAQKSMFNYKPFVSTTSEYITIAIDVDRSSPLSVYGRQNEATFTPLPVNALGTEYVVSSCHISGTGTTSMLLVTGYKQTAIVNVRFDNEQTFTANGNSYVNETEYTIKVLAYESLVLLSDNSFAESMILSDNVIAVYSGVIEKNVVIMYTQLLPVSHLGNRFNVYFDESRMAYAADIMSVYNDTDLNSSTSMVLRGFSGRFSYSSSNNLVELIFSKTTSLMLCGKDGLRGMAVLPPQALFQTKVFLPLNGDTIIIVHPHRQNSVNVSDRSVQNVQWRFNGGVHVGVVRIPSVPGQSLVITALESFYVIAASENHIYTAGFSPSYQPTEQDDDDTDIIFGVAAGSGVSLTGALFIGGAAYIRRRRRRQNRDGGDQAEGQGDNYPPALPPPPKVAA